MAMFEKFDNPYGVTFANNGDVCYWCCEEYLKNPEKDEDVRTMSGAEIKLRGQLEGQRVQRFKNYSFCKKHLLEVLKVMNLTEEDIKELSGQDNTNEENV